MTRAWTASLAVVLIAGCSSSSSRDADFDRPEAAVMPAPDPGSTRETRLNQLRSTLAEKKAELSKAEQEASALQTEREDLNGRPASDAKNNRLAELATIDAGLKRQRQALGLDIAELENQIRDLSSGSSTAPSDDALAAALEADAEAEREKAERRRAAEEAERATEARKVDRAEAARVAEEKARAENKVEGVRPVDAGAEGALFEDRYADVILKVKEALQAYKRW